MKFRVCSRCKTPTKKPGNPDYSYQCLHCDEDLYEFETEEIETVKAVNPVVIGSAKDGGFVGFHACDKMCMSCGGENYNIPVANVSLCVHCGVELLPCTACISESADSCDFDLAKGGCYRFHHSDNFLAKHDLQTYYVYAENEGVES